MKASHTRRNNGKTYDLGEMVPNTTNEEHMQRVEEWTMKSAAIPPSNSKKTPKQFEAEDHEAKSQLIIEAVRLLDTRERQLRYKPAEDVMENDDSWSIFGSSNRFRESNQSAKAFVKDFEGKVNQKKAYDSMILSSYPIARSTKNLVTHKGLHELKTTLGLGNPVLEPESWRFKASRSVKFSIKQPDTLPATQKASEVFSDDRWALKQENDRDWWKWKLKQGFIQNDELLQKLVSQRQNLEQRASLKPDGFKSKRNLVAKNKNTSSPPVPSSRNSSRHIAVEIPVQRIRTLSHQPKTKEPIPNFYTPSKQLVQIMAATAASDQNHAKTAKQKMQTLKKDPYLAKLLAGNEAFKPEAMITANIPSRRHDLAAQQMKSTGDGNVVKRKISLESLPESDDDDELTAAKFFNRDVRVLYEKLSDLDATATRNNMLQSREPSDGYLNLPILLATGRFSRFSKLPSMKFARNEPSSRGYKRSDRSSLLQSVPRVSNPMNPRMTRTTTGEETKTNIPAPRIEDLPTKEWAKHVLSKFRKQGKPEEVEMQEPDNQENSQASKNDDEEPVEVVHSSQPQRKQNMKSVDEETNMLYHDILMSKWKKEKHETAVRNKANAKWKKYEYDHQNDPTKTYTKPRGLDIWLENIREKAKRDRLIAPYTVHDPRDSGYPVPELVTTFENAAFALQK